MSDNPTNTNDKTPTDINDKTPTNINDKTNSTTNTANAEFPAKILLEKWTKQRFFWQGQVDVCRFERLWQLLLRPKQKSDNPTLSVTCQVAEEGGKLWLEYQVAGVLWLTCHRCLAPLVYDVSDQYRLALVQNDSEAAGLDDDFICLNELDDERWLPVLTLLEDELLLLLPLSATHDDCQMLIETDDKPTDNPFAVLAQLKTGQ